MDKPQRIEGDQWDGGVVDESCDQRPDSFGRSILPALSHRYGWCWRIGVPKRVGCGAIEFKEFFYKGIEAARKAAEEGVQSEHESYTWPSEDILTEDQLHWARENLDPIDYNEQYRASWESCGGMIFHQFHETMNIRDDICYDPNKPLIIGSDFNVSPMAWVVCQTHEELGIKYLYVLDELFIHNTNTQATLDKLFYSYGRSHNGGFYFFGDATSRARNTRASESDYVQIRNDMRFKGARVFYPKHNPNRANRFAACNAQFCNTLGIRRCFVHKRCKNLIRDLLLRAYKEGTTEPDDYGDVGHITDALGYVIYTIFPLHVEQDIRAEIYVG
jgi:hypothetical protein